MSRRVPSLSAAWALLSIRPAGLDVQTQSAGTPGKRPAGLAGPPYSWPSCLHGVAAGQPPVGVERDRGHSCPRPPALHVTVCSRLGLSFQFCFLVGDPWDSSHLHPSLCPPVLSQAGRGSPSRACGRPVLAEGGQAAQVRGGGVGGLLVLSGASGVGGAGCSSLLPAKLVSLDSRPGHSRGGPGPGLPPARRAKGAGCLLGLRASMMNQISADGGGAPSHRECLLHP